MTPSPPTSDFAPGFRLSKRDAFTLVAGSLVAAFSWTTLDWLGCAVAFAVSHYFLFCNVFRIARVQELAWTAFFLVLVYSSAVSGRPAWPATFAISMIATVAAVGLELRKPSYHGVGWHWINPRLREWWDASLK